VPIVAYQPREHGAFVYSFFAAGSGEPRETLDALFDSGARWAVLVSPNDPDTFAAFAVVMPAPQTVAWVHTKWQPPEKPQARRRGFAKALLRHLGVQLDQPVTALYWSPAIPQLRRRGYVITPPKETHVEREARQDHQAR
jgi:hypothetical protein